MTTTKPDHPRTEAELRAARPSIYVRTFWFAMRVALRVAGTLVIPIIVFWTLMWTLGTDATAHGPFSYLALWSWAVVSFAWALIDASRRPVVMNLITWLLVFLGVGAVMTFVAFTADWRLTSDAILAAVQAAIRLVGRGSLVPAAIGVAIGTVIKVTWGLVRHRPAVTA